MQSNQIGLGGHPRGHIASNPQEELLNDVSRDALARRAAGGVSRRASLLTLGAAGFAAALASPFTTDAKKKDKRRASGRKSEGMGKSPRRPHPLPIR